MDSVQKIGAACFDDDGWSELSDEMITRKNFNGRNGIWNSCALIKMEWLAKRRFREDVFASEDQEWSAWLLRTQEQAILRVKGAGMNNTSRNPHLGKYEDAKYLNDMVAVAYFVDRKRLSPLFVARVIMRALYPFYESPRLRWRVVQGTLALRLIACWFRRPVATSRYFR
jgi:hypothetical protein